MADIVFSFDTTGSMSACIRQVRKQVHETVKRLFASVPNLRIGVISHGDYCDGRYVISILDLTEDQGRIARFLQECPDTEGGDADECYELVLHEARNLTWRAGVPRVLALIGDANPHGPNYPQNTRKLDWRNELDLLTESQIKVYGVQALNRREASRFYEEIARRTGGFHLNLDQFSDVTEMITAVCLKQAGGDHLQSYVDDLQKKGKVSRSTSAIYGKLLGKEAPVVSYGKISLDVVSPGRFQVLDVDRECSIQDFVEGSGARFQRGKGFYQFTARTMVQENKEVVLVHRTTGDMFSGAKAREMLGVPLGTRGKVSPSEAPGLAGYDAFIQSTSNNRTLFKGTRFLYEIDET